MEQKKFDFWQEHSNHYPEMAFRHDRRKVIEHPEGYGKRTGNCGDTVEMFLTILNAAGTQKIKWRLNDYP